jgi:hypothetical protein
MIAPALVTLAVDQSQRPARAVVGEQALAAAHRERVDHHPILVDQLAPDQRAEQLRAADHQQ